VKLYHGKEIFIAGYPQVLSPLSLAAKKVEGKKLPPVSVLVKEANCHIRRRPGHGQSSGNYSVGAAPCGRPLIIVVPEVAVQFLSERRIPL
jgi:hypothetical protein